MNATIEYDNDTGPGDEGFSEWWTVVCGEMSFRCSNEKDAQWLRHLINSISDNPLPPCDCSFCRSQID